jgi:phage terminase large subunit GpA-like protein
MSDSTSTPSPISGSRLHEGDELDLTDGLDLEFDGAEDILRSWRKGMRPDPDLTVSEWADEHRWLSSRGAAEPGRYRTARAPYLREIMDALSPRHPAQRISFMKAAQVGATEAGNNWIGFVIHHAPGPMLAVLPSLELAKRTSRGRLDPLIAESPALRERVNPARSRDAGNSMLSKEFPGGILVLTGANSATGLRSMPARYIFLDEVDAYPASADEEGDPVTLAEARTTTFSHRRKVFMVSTPTIRGVSRIEREFDASDQRRYFVPCPHCGAMQWLQFERLRWDKGRPDTAAYHCEGCEKPIAEHHKTQMLERGEWRATAVSADPHSIGFHLSALYSPLGWKSWQQIAREWLAAQGSEEMLRVARNTLLGETWVESGDAPEWQRLAERRESYAGVQIPVGGLFLTAGVDVQKDRIEVDVWAWGRGLESWLVDHIVIAGGPDDPACWDKLTALLGRTWTCANGAVMAIGKLAIDTGYEAPAVYAWARKQGFDQVAPIKGLEGFNRATPVSGPTFVDATIGGKRLRRGARLWSVATATFKTETYRFLRLERPIDEGEAEPSRQWRGVSPPNALGVHFPPGTVHLPDWIDTEWLKQLVAEQLVTVRNKRGYAHPEWQKMRERNEALDTRVYARAAAWIMGADRWDEATWRRLEAQAGVVTRQAPPPAIATEPLSPTPVKAGTPTTPRRKRRAYTPNFMRD